MDSDKSGFLAALSKNSFRYLCFCPAWASHPLNTPNLLMGPNQDCEKISASCIAWVKKKLAWNTPPSLSYKICKIRRQNSNNSMTGLRYQMMNLKPALAGQNLDLPGTCQWSNLLDVAAAQMQKRSKKLEPNTSKYIQIWHAEHQTLRTLIVREQFCFLVAVLWEEIFCANTARTVAQI